MKLVLQLLGIHKKQSKYVPQARKEQRPISNIAVPPVKEQLPNYYKIVIDGHKSFKLTYSIII